jgi:hypothetical protein
MHIVDDRRRITLNGTWKFVMDPEGQGSLDRMQAIFNAAAPVISREVVARLRAIRFLSRPVIPRV